MRKALEARREIGIAGGVFEHVAPVGLPQRHLHVGGRQTRTESACHQAPHAGARYAINRDTQLLQFLQHPDVGGTTRTAAAQHQPDAGRCLGMGQRRQPVHSQRPKHRHEASQGELADPGNKRAA